MSVTFEFQLWISYFDDSTLLPPPFNVLPTPYSILKYINYIIPVRYRIKRDTFSKRERFPTQSGNFPSGRSGKGIYGQTTNWLLDWAVNLYDQITR